MSSKYTTVSLPTGLAEDVRELIAKVRYWPSFAAFVREATLEKLRSENARLEASG